MIVTFWCVSASAKCCSSARARPLVHAVMEGAGEVIAVRPSLAPRRLTHTNSSLLLGISNETRSNESAGGKRMSMPRAMREEIPTRDRRGGRVSGTYLNPKWANPEVVEKWQR